MDLADIMATTFASVSPEMSIAEAARHMIEIDTGAAAVIEDGSLIGMISERDLLRFLSAGREPRGEGLRPHDAPRADRRRHRRRCPRRWR